MTKYLSIRLIFTLSLLLAIGFTQAQNRTKVELVQARVIRSDANLFNGARRVIGNVMFKQDSVIMKCDSAHFYSDRNMFDAFGNVHLYKLNDTSIDVRANTLRHDGDAKIAHFYGNVILRDNKIILTTDTLDYNLQTDVGSYENKGKIVDSLTVLTSLKGFYFHHQREVYFWNNVVIDHNNGEYQMFTDTIRYGTESKIVNFFGPTEFVNDTNYMFAKYGWYNTITEQSMFKNEALFKNPSQTISCDSIKYNRTQENGIAYSNVVATDTVQNLVVKGNYVEIHKNPELLVITDMAQIIYVMDNDSLYMHADTMMVCRDTTGEFRTFRAFWHVRAYKSDLQFQTDSVFFSMHDSIAKFYGSPIFWIQDNQITSDYIEAFVKDNQLEKFTMNNGGMIVSPHDSIYYNQIRGAKMVGYMRNNDLYKVDVSRRSQTLYFPVDDGNIIGVNKGESVNMTIYIKNKELKRIVYKDRPTSNMYPLSNMVSNDLYLQGFMWHDKIKPQKPADIFIWQNIDSSLENNTIKTNDNSAKKRVHEYKTPPLRGVKSQN